jgi:hypothetical protein
MGTNSMIAKSKWITHQENKEQIRKIKDFFIDCNDVGCALDTQQMEKLSDRFEVIASDYSKKTGDVPYTLFMSMMYFYIVMDTYQGAFHHLKMFFKLLGKQIRENWRI